MALKGTTIKEAIARFEEKENVKASEAEEIDLCCQNPPIEEMDASLSTLMCCIKLNLSSNAIEKIANLNGLRHLKILSLTRNAIRSFTGLEAVGETLEELWMSFNSIKRLKGVFVLKKLKVLDISNNFVKDEPELDELMNLRYLEELEISGNPVQELFGGEFQDRLKYRLPRLKKLNGIPMV